MTAAKEQRARDIASSNAASAVDEVGGHYKTLREATAAHAVNVLDTMEEEGIRYGREVALQAFLADVEHFAVLHDSALDAIRKRERKLRPGSILELGGLADLNQVKPDDDAFWEMVEAIQRAERLALQLHVVERTRAEQRELMSSEKNYEAPRAWLLLADELGRLGSALLLNSIEGLRLLDEE
jgi:hypothetical protein